MRQPPACVIALLAAASSVTALDAPFVTADIAIYGGTSGGVVAAVQAARMGRRAIIVSPDKHLGGMSSSGLGVTDKGVDASIGGLSLEFYRRVGARYGKAIEWWFEPRVAEAVFESMVEEAGVTVLREARLASITKSGAAIRTLTTADGHRIAASIWIDASYEGDLMAAAGVPHVIGREANATFGETLNGIRQPSPWSPAVDPWKVPGQPASGLCEGITALTAGPAGSADGLTQAYNFRLCLTNVAANRMALSAPQDYDAAHYELLARLVAARVAAGQTVRLRDLIDVQLFNGQPILPNGKTDINAAGVFSTDMAGGSSDWATASWEARRLIATGHESFIRGLLWFLASDPRIPASVRTDMNQWGFCRDEFTDNGGWPWQIYVREARRMRGATVITEHDAMGTRAVPDAIGLASYALDSHVVQRVVHNGQVANEGGFFVTPPQPWPIAWRALTPVEADCPNLLCTFALSSTHAAFSSLRMEPVFMITCQAAATGAARALDLARPVQQIDVDWLQGRLRADGQLIAWRQAPPGSVITDTEDAATTVAGSWTQATAIAGFNGRHYLSDGNTAKGTNSVVFRPQLPAPGRYRVSLTWRWNPGRATNVPVAITHGGGTASLTVNQNTNPGTWTDLGVFSFPDGSTPTLTLSNAGTDGTVIADAVLWSPDPVPVSLVAAAAATVEGSTRPARLSAVIPAPLAAPLVVSLTVTGGTAGPDDFSPLPPAITIPAGAVSASLPLTAPADSLVEGTESLTVALAASPDLQPGRFPSVTLTVTDPPWDAWRAAHFPPQDIAAAGRSEPLADPDGDDLTNLVEWHTAGNPLAADQPPLSLAPGPDPGTFLVSLRLARGIDPAASRLEMSRDLVSWEPAGPLPIADHAEVPAASGRPAADRLTLRWSPPAGRRALRLRVALP